MERKSEIVRLIRWFGENDREREWRKMFKVSFRRCLRDGESREVGIFFFFSANNRKVKTEKRLARNDDETTYVFKLITFAYVPSDRLAMVEASATSWYTRFVKV